MSLHESGDLEITKVLGSNGFWVDVEARERIELEQIKLFKDLFQNVRVYASSSWARFGINSVPLGKLVWEGRDLVTRLRISNFISEYFFVGRTLDEFIKEGLLPGKYYLDENNMHLDADSVKAALDKREIITGERCRLNEDGTLFVPFRPYKFLPTDIYTPDALRKILSGKEYRSRLTKYQKGVPIDRFIVGKNNGLVTAITLITTGLEVKVEDPSIPGVKHSEARIGSQNTRYDFYCEFIGDTNEDVEIEGVQLEFIRPKTKTKKHFVPASIRSSGEVHLDGNLPLRALSEQLQQLGDDVVSIEYFDLSRPNPVYGKLRRTELRSAGTFQQRFKGNRDISLLFNQFPGRVGSKPKRGEVLEDLIEMARRGRVRNVYLLNGSYDVYFSDKSISDISRLSRHADVFLRDPNSKRWRQFYRNIWVYPDKLEYIDNLYRSGRVVVFYGSASKIEEDAKKIVDHTLDDLIKFYGNKFIVAIGGWGKEGSFMHYVSQKAQERGLPVVSINWNISNQMPNFDADGVQHYDEKHLLPRQENLGKRSEITVFGLGADGTDAEFAIDRTLRKGGIGARKLMLLMGKASERLKHVRYLVAEGLSIDDGRGYIYPVKLSTDVYEIARKHFKTS